MIQLSVNDHLESCIESNNIHIILFFFFFPPKARNYPIFTLKTLIIQNDNQETLMMPQTTKNANFGIFHTDNNHFGQFDNILSPKNKFQFP